MRISSAKAKGRRACQEAKEEILRALPSLKPDDLQVTSSGVTGEDIKLSPAASRMLPIVVECKNQENINIWKAYEQALEHGNKKPELIPVVIYRRNRSDLMITLNFEDFLSLCKRAMPQPPKEEDISCPEIHW